MRRIYLESLIGLLVCFMAGIIAYEISVYQLNTDYEYVLQDYEAAAHQQLIENIAKNQGLEAAHQAINQFVETTRNKLVILSPQDEIPGPVSQFFIAHPDTFIFHDDERDLWFRLASSDNTYHYLPNSEAFVRQKIELEDDLIWLFFLGSFILYGLCHVLIIFRRVKKLESATLSFAEGDLSSRAETSSGIAIGSLNKSFNLMADRIHRLIESNRSLTNAVAHELRTPIFRIQWQAEMLKDTPLSEEQEKTIESIVEDTEEMEKMVDELLYYAKLDSTELESLQQPLEIKDFLEHATTRWSKETALSIDLYLPEHEQSIVADETLLNRALDNLVRNAMKFARTQISIEVTKHQEQLQIAVHDDGDGVAEEHRAHLFDPFYVGDKARNKAKSGHGLGLSIVHKICAQHHATVQIAQSPSLKGAVFTITFPLCNEAADKAIQ
ncbi:Sensory histidine kinase in two-component regulatory system with RstA [Vibrio chagasii]|uniref:ATP-binding protein n=1 Tax=Vibrio chagasii TaxID=170679 RepID=UPI00164032C2|nr:ATP-binding protein [Vibrio chagasii]CAH6840109.1 Sensory histidine kinase in two-component regulatory system with RstA [Vibrio chagasii]CAH6840536.1 Sensory histidine kinase in two-component regulatory system with RstA [Vibrio chagasii]CAH6842057.1 Sensory histidine kinase in two-component regulatory system with RstA [Vibrio chagasii]CAH6850172.1 Sensory histidine kinase in two-component regulatory system with RstA [Vibrio chagasii]CAH6851754.1 Sensory histidine kinase in two-component reg